MTTVVSGLIKIGKTGNEQFENRMRFLESNGYANITGLKRVFAIEVDEYDDKEKLIHDIFSKSRISNTELFALDIETAKSLLASLDGKQIYPKDKTKKEVFEESTEEIKLKTDTGFIPDGEYFLNRNITKLYHDIYSALNISITFLVDGKKYNRIMPLSTFKDESYAYTKDFISDFLSSEQLNLINNDRTKLKVLTVTCIYNIEVYLKIITE